MENCEDVRRRLAQMVELLSQDLHHHNDIQCTLIKAGQVLYESSAAAKLKIRELVEELTSGTDQTLRTLDEEIVKKNQMLNIGKELCVERIRKTAACSEEILSILESTDWGMVTDSGNAILKLSEQLLKETPQLPSYTDRCCAEFCPNPQLMRLLGQTKSIGTVKYTSVMAKQVSLVATKLEYFLPVRSGEASFEVRCEKGSADALRDMVVVVNNPKGNTVREMTKVGKRNGVCTYRFTPSMAGMYSLQCRVFDEHVKGSPLLVTVHSESISRMMHTDSTSGDVYESSKHTEPESTEAGPYGDSCFGSGFVKTEPDVCPPGREHTNPKSAEPIRISPVRAPEPVKISPVRAPEPVKISPVRGPEPVKISPVRGPEPVKISPVRGPEPVKISPVKAPEPITICPVKCEDVVKQSLSPSRVQPGSPSRPKRLRTVDAETFNKKTILPLLGNNMAIDRAAANFLSDIGGSSKVDASPSKSMPLNAGVWDECDSGRKVGKEHVSEKKFWDEVESGKKVWEALEKSGKKVCEDLAIGKMVCNQLESEKKVWDKPGSEKKVWDRLECGKKVFEELESEKKAQDQPASEEKVWHEPTRKKTVWDRLESGDKVRNGPASEKTVFVKTEKVDEEFDKVCDGLAALTTTDTDKSFLSESHSSTSGDYESLSNHKSAARSHTPASNNQPSVTEESPKADQRRVVITGTKSPVAEYKAPSPEQSFIIKRPYKGKLLGSVGRKGHGKAETLWFPIGVSSNHDGSIVVCDCGNNMLKVFSHQYEFKFSVSGGKDEFKMDRPSAVVVNNQGDMFVKDDHQIFVFDVNGNCSMAFGKEELHKPYGLVMTCKQHLLTVDHLSSSRISLVLFDQKGHVINKSPPLSLTCSVIQSRPKCRFLASHGDRVYLVDLGSSVVHMTDMAGQLLRTFGGYGSGPGEFREPSGITVDGAGSLLIADSKNNRVQVFSPTGDYLGFIILSEPITRPSDIHLTNSGNLIISNYLQHCAKVYSLKG